MATEMRFVMSTKENALVFMTFLLIPCFVLGFMGMSRMRAASEQFETNPDMPQVKDLLYAFSFSFCIIFLRYYSTKMLKPVSRLILSPEKRTNEERVDRFATVAFKFRSDLYLYSEYF
jgi:hypothetical protein